MASNHVYQRAEKILEVRNLSLSYGEKTILKDVSVGISNVTRPGLNQGQVVALLGPSGIGKTQLFRCLAGLQKPTAGDVLVTDKLIPVRAGMVGVVAQNYILFRHRTVIGNLIVAGEQKGMSRKNAEEKALELLEYYGLADRKHFYPKNLSGGQRQRVAIIQQILSSEHFLLMDEPFSGLDPIMKDRACETVNKFSQLHELNTIVVVTHDIESAVAIADTVWLMGRVRGQGGQNLGATIVKQYDLIEAGLAWNPDIQQSSRFFELVSEIKREFRNC